MDPRTRAGAEVLASPSRPLKRARIEAYVSEDFSTDMEADCYAAKQSQGKVWRKELIKLLEQALASLGFVELSDQLATESAIEYENARVGSFRRALLYGDYEQALRLLDNLGLVDEQVVKKSKFLILEQKFLEDLSRGDVTSALQVLQQDLAALEIREARLHKLAGCILCTSQESLRDHLSWAGTKGSKNREQLLHDIQEVIPPDIMLPEGRLESLLEQALMQQLTKMDLRVPLQMPVSLLTDYSFSRGHIPTHTTQVLTDHSEEVWHIQFSHNGRFLASASKDASAIIWEVTASRQLRRQHILRGHTAALTFCAWSPDDRMLATCSNDNLVKLWDVASGICMRTIDRHEAPSTTAAWLPDGRGVLTSAEDKWIYLSYLESDQAFSWQSEGVNELIMLNDGRLLFTPYGKNQVDVWRMTKLDTHIRAELPLVVENDCIVSCAVSHDGTKLLLNMSTRAVHLWKIPAAGSQEGAIPLQRFRGAKERQSRFVVRSCFGGYNDSYVLSGSEECKVFVWHSTSGELLASLEGHSGTVNSVSWNPRDHHMFASASDDKSIHIWGLDPDSSSGSAGFRGPAQAVSIPQTAATSRTPIPP